MVYCSLSPKSKSYSQLYITTILPKNINCNAHYKNATKYDKNDFFRLVCIILQSTHSTISSLICTMKVQNLKEDFFMSNENTISYHRVGDYNIPNLTLPPEEASVRLGKWGMLHKDYLLKNRKVAFLTLLAEGKLYQHCANVENKAQQTFDTLVEQMKTAESVTERLKEENQIEWICRMQNIEARAREIVNSEIIFN